MAWEENRMSHQSLATIDSPEFINLQPLDINPLMSSCEIKVLYIGENRNNSYISKEVANEMAKTLRGAPIVGYYREEKEDFADHGERMIWDDEGIKFECLTKPYGFVAPDAQVWFKKFQEKDDFGNEVTREYLMTTGYLWTGQFPECAAAATEEGKGQSMELDEKSLDGHWSTNTKTGMDFFIINDAIFSKLCILGDDVEPCFEGAKIAAPEVSKTFSKVDDGFKKTLFTMMQELKFALEGGKNMDNENSTVVNNEEVTVGKETITTTVAAEVVEDNKVEDNQNPETESVDTEDVETPAGDETVDTEGNNAQVENTEEVASEFTLEELQAKYSELQTQYTSLQAKYNELEEFKTNIENEKKDALIKSFYMLSDEDKKDVIENKAKYSLDDIEAKLSVICVRKKVNFDLEDNSKNDNKVEEEKEATVTFALDSNVEESVPAWVSALRKTQNARKEK